MQKSSLFSVLLHEGKYKLFFLPNPMTLWNFLQLLGMARNLVLCLIWAKVFRSKSYLALKKLKVYYTNIIDIKEGSVCVSSSSHQFPSFLWDAVETVEAYCQRVGFLGHVLRLPDISFNKSGPPKIMGMKQSTAILSGEITTHNIRGT